MKNEKIIREIMTENVVTVSPDTSIVEIQEIFAKQSFHHLPVVKTGNKLVGIISRDDLRIFYQNAQPASVDQRIETTCAKDIMTAAPLVLDPDDEIGLAADIFLANKFHALPIVEDDALLGILTTHDIIAYSVRKETLSKSPTTESIVHSQIF